MNYKVSVVIPMYKARDYIIENVDSLLAQTLPELEVVIVNDCTPDDSMEICRSHYSENERVQLIDQPKNMGPGAARNAGVKVARGEYIAFVDSDDAVLPDTYEKMYKVAKENDADVLHNTGFVMPLVMNAPTNLLNVPEDDRIELPTDRYDTAQEIKVVSDDMGERFANWKKEEYHWAVWNKLYRKEFLVENDLHFGDMKLAEDMVFCFGCLFHAKKYVLMPGFFYLYRMSEVSLCRGSDTLKLLERSLVSAIGSVPAMKNGMKGVAFFEEHPEYAQEAIDFVIRNLEMLYIIPCFQSAGAEKIEEDGRVKRIISEKFGESADYVYYAFMEQHKNYPPKKNYVEAVSDVASLVKLKEQYGKEAVLEMFKKAVMEEKK